jgi:hypothetical protein
MKEIKLTQGQIAIVDDEDFEELNKFKWCAQENPIGKFYNGNQLDNRRVNLRLVTRQQNSFNRKHPQKINNLGVKGVHWHKRAKKYRSCIRYNGKLIHLGLFVSLEDADKAYRAAEIKYFGNFAR